MKTVLIIDDHADTHRLITSVLQGPEVRVVSAHDGLEGLTSARAEAPDLILLDVTMPNKGGMEVLQELGEDAQTRQIPVVMLTGETDDATIGQALSTGASYFVRKPFQPAEVCQLVRTVLGVA
jgi:CheY-like chemotaxis protein